MLEDERHSGRPLAAHADAEERAQREQHRVRRREAAEKREEREPHDRQHQGKLAAPLVRGGAGRDATDQAHDERDGAQRAGQRAIDGEAVLDVDQDEGHDVEVERIDDPSEKHRPEGAPLIAADLSIPGSCLRWNCRSVVPKRFRDFVQLGNLNASSSPE